MTTKKEYQNCKHWLYLPCPEKNNNFMMKTKPSTPPGSTLTEYDIEQINKLCKKCKKFEPNQ
jgi:hypothetical protein